MKEEGRRFPRTRKKATSRCLWNTEKLKIEQFLNLLLHEDTSFILCVISLPYSVDNSYGKQEGEI